MPDMSALCTMTQNAALIVRKYVIPAALTLIILILTACENPFAGISSGVSGILIAAVSVVSLCPAATLLCFSPPGQYTLFDGVLKCNPEHKPGVKKNINEVIPDIRKSYAVISVWDVTHGKRVDCFSPN